MEASKKMALIENLIKYICRIGKMEVPVAFGVTDEMVRMIVQ